MKWKDWFIGSLCLAFGSLGMASCEDNEAEILFFAGEQCIGQAGTCTNQVGMVTLYANGKPDAEVGIACGKGGYQAVTSDVDVVKVRIEGERLLLSWGGKPGKAEVTVTDEKGNRAVLPVEAGEGAYALAYSDERFVVMKDNVPVSDEALTRQVSEAMAGYRLLADGGRYVLVPEDLDVLTGEGAEGRLLVCRDGGAALQEGTYTGLWDAGLTGKNGLAWDFAYGAERHRFYLNPRSEEARANGPVPLLLAEDVTAECPASLFEALPEGARVVYVLDVQSLGLRLLADILPQR